MAIDYRSELRRPLPFSLAVVTTVLLIWLIVASVAVRQELGIGEPLLVRDVVRGDRLAAADRAALGRAGARVHDRMVDDTGLPPDAGTHQQRLAVGTQLHDLRKVGPERLADEAACLGEDLVELHRTQRQVAEPGQHALLGEQHPLLVVRLFGHGPPG